MINIILALVICTGINDTAKIQGSIDTETVTTVTGTCAVPGQPGVRIGTGRTLELYGATIFQGPNIGGTGLGRNRIFETIPGSSNIRIRGGRLVGSREFVPGLQWSIGVRIDSATDVVVEDMDIVDFFTDGIAVNGNPPGSSEVTIRNNRVAGAKRNALSLTSGSGIRVIGNVFEETNCFEDWKTQVPYNPLTACGDRNPKNAENNMPLCAIDFEPNEGEKLVDVAIIDNILRNNQKCGVFLQSNQFLGGDTLIYHNRCEGNGTWCVAANQVTNAWIFSNTAVGGTLGYSFGAGVRNLIAVKNEVSGNSGNAFNFAGAWGPYVAQNKTGGKPVAFIAITSPVKMNGVDGDVSIRSFE